MQPNGKFCIFDSRVDMVIKFDLELDGLIYFFVEQSKDEITTSVISIVSQLKGDEKPYFQFTLPYDKMLELIEDVHGEETMNQVKNSTK